MTQPTQPAPPSHQRLRIFLSYATADRERVLGVRALLEIGGAEVFTDWLSIPAGTDWKAALASAVAACDVLCVFWTKATSASEWVKREYTTFLALHPGRQCIPLVADDTPLPEPLASRQALPNFLALANELVSLRRDLDARGVSRGERERLVRKRLEIRGVRLSDSDMKRVLVLAAGAGGVSFATLLLISLRPTVPKLLGMLAVAGTGVALLGNGCTRLSCTAAVPDKPDAGQDAGGKVRPTATAAGSAGAKTAAIPVVPPPAPTTAEVTSSSAAAEDPPVATCIPHPGPDADARPVEDPAVAATGASKCTYLDQALRACQRDFKDVISGQGWVDVEGQKRAVTFPLCEKDSPSLVTWATSLREGSLSECEVHRYLSSPRDEEAQGPQSMFQTCRSHVNPDQSGLDAFDELRKTVAECLREDRQWTTNDNSRPSVDPAGRLVLHTDRGGIARVYFTRDTETRSFSVSIVLRSDEDISLDQASSGRRPNTAQLELHVALSSLKKPK